MKKIEKPCFADGGSSLIMDCEIRKEKTSCMYNHFPLVAHRAEGKKGGNWKACSKGALSQHYKWFKDLTECPWCKGELTGGKT